MLEINRVIDLTKNNFGRINFEEAEILEFDYFNKPFENVEFEIWGAKLLVDDFWDHDKSFLLGVPHSDDYYVAGKGIIRIQHVLGIDMFFSPYVKTEDSYQFVHDSTGNVIEKRWRRGEIKKGDDYLWECVLIHPHGYFKLNIYACGCVKYEFDDKDMVLEKEFLKSPFKYAYGNVDSREL